MKDSAEVVTDLVDGKERKEEVNQYEGSCVTYEGVKGAKIWAHKIFGFAIENNCTWIIELDKISCSRSGWCVYPWHRRPLTFLTFQTENKFRFSKL